MTPIRRPFTKADREWLELEMQSIAAKYPNYKISDLMYGHPNSGDFMVDVKDASTSVTYRAHVPNSESLVTFSEWLKKPFISLENNIVLFGGGGYVYAIENWRGAPTRMTDRV